MDTSHSAAAARPSVVSLRRRGPVLERAILDAALEQLSTVGWNGLTMEGVAMRRPDGESSGLPAMALEGRSGGGGAAGGAAPGR